MGVLLDKLAKGKMANWYNEWKSPGHNVPDLTERKVEDLDYVFNHFKRVKNVSALKCEDIDSKLIRAYLIAGNQHPAKDPETRDLFSKDEPVLGLTYEWSLGLSKNNGVSKRLMDRQLLDKIREDDPLFWIDVLFIDQLSKNITMDLAKAQGIYIKCKFHAVLGSLTLLQRGWCLFELCLRHHVQKPSLLIGAVEHKVRHQSMNARERLNSVVPALVSFMYLQ